MLLHSLIITTLHNQYSTYKQLCSSVTRSIYSKLQTASRISSFVQAYGFLKMQSSLQWSNKTSQYITAFHHFMH